MTLRSHQLVGVFYIHGLGLPVGKGCGLRAIALYARLPSAVSLAAMALRCPLVSRLTRRLTALLTSLLALLAWPSQVSAAAAADAPTATQPIVVEMLRLSVPSTMQAAWVEAEQSVWQPWLERQDGFLRKDVLWNPQQEEGQVLIHWRREAWKAIPSQDVDAVQARFVEVVNQATGRTSADPIPLLASEEWPLLASIAGSQTATAQHSRSPRSQVGEGDTCGA